jgi:hypothetical protein
LVQKLSFFTRNVRKVIFLSIFCIYLYMKNNLEVIFMKKILLLPLFAAMALVSQAWAQAEFCTVNGGTLFCQIGAGCFKYSPKYSGVGENDATCGPKNNSNPTCDCDQLLEGCQDFGQAYINVNESALTAGNKYGEGVICSENGGTLIGGAQKCGTCQYPTGCYAIWSGGSESKGENCTIAMATCATDGGTTGCEEGSGGGTSSSSGGNQPSSSSGGTDPIISYNSAAVTGLNVAHFARSLQIASGKDATVSLFDMHGKQVFSQKVLSGTTTISLEKQRQGVYYAVVRSGSQKQTVKVVLK